MLIGTLDEVEFAPEYPELAGKRVLITGVSGPLGVDVVRAFAEAGTRLVVQAVEDGPETLALAEIIAPHAMDVRLFSGALDLVCYGHDHTQHLERIGDCWLLNPGEILGMKSAPTWALRRSIF